MPHEEGSPERLTPAARRILDVAAKLFYENGIHAVGVESIAAAAGVTKKTLYDRFGSKDALITMYLRRRDERWRERVRTAVGDSRRTTLARKPLLVFDELERWMAEREPRGCAFVNAQAELPDGAHPGREVIRGHKQWMLDYLTELVRDAGLRNPRKLATALFLLLEGATVAVPAQVPANPIGPAKEAAKALLAAG